MKKLLSLLLIICMLLACAASVAAVTAAKTPTDAKKLTFTDSAKNYFTNANHATASIVNDDTESGRSVLLTPTANYTDPYIYFNYSAYVDSLGLSAPTANNVKYVLFKIKQERCVNNMFEIFYCTSGGVSGPTGGYSITRAFDNSEAGWQYVVFNMNGIKGWSGTIKGFRIDWVQNAASANEKMYINEVILIKDDAALQEYLTSNDPHALSEADQTLADYLLKNAVDTAPAISNDPITAEHEDSSLSMWFDHSYNNTPAEDVTSTGMNSYQIRLAKNEIEGCHLMLASTADKSGLTLEISDFENGQGATLTKEICYGYYFDKVEGKTVADPIPLLEHEFDLAKNKSKMFIIKVKSTSQTPSGQYTATVVLKDAEGKEIKKANVYAYVWDFTLPEASNVKTLTDLDWNKVYAGHRLYAGDDSLMYSIYYDYLLENKMCLYTLPYSNEGAYDDDRVEKYLNDPRVTAYTLMWKKQFNESWITKAYNRVSKNQSWLEKAYFYPVDEPMTKAKLDEIINDAKTIKKIFGDDYKLIVPMHWNLQLDTSTYKMDSFEYLKDYVNVWCPHTFFFNTYADYKANPLLTYRCNSKTEENLGTFVERMAAEQEKGNEVWWYVTRYPHYPEITLSISDPSVDHRLFFWQQKLYNVDGFLYYMANDWYHIEGTDTNRYMWDKKEESSTDPYTPYTVYGNGVLVYCGAGLQEYLDKYSEGDYGAVGYYGPVGSLRLESVRDGIEDYDYFVLLDEKYGEGTSDLLIKQVTTSLGNFKSDSDLFNEVRLAAGNLIAGEKLELPQTGTAGDVNKDGKVNNKDVVALFRYVSNKDASKVDVKACDCNGDGKENNKDVVHLFRYVSNNSLPIYYDGKLQ